MSWRTRLIFIGLAAVVGSLAWAVFARMFAPVGNTTRSHFDAIIVMGTPADSEGNPTPTQLAIVSESVREYERGVAPRLIVTGGPAHNQFVEARVLSRVAHAQGVPESAIFVEPEAMDTIQNACYAARIAKEHNWHSAEIVSVPYHLPRAGLIFSRLPLEWRTHAAPLLVPGSGSSTYASESLETLKTVRYLLYGNWAERCEP
jgi:uncharacterized SAM-binding protein YcdF (DUF218 family)